MTGISEVEVTTYSTDLSLDSDGTVESPTKSFKIVISGLEMNLQPLELYLDVKLMHPCRNAEIVSQVIQDMTAVVSG